MFTVIKKPLTPNTLWDAENKCLLCRFERGKLETDDISLAEKLKVMGYEVAGEAEEKEENGNDADGQECGKTEDGSRENFETPDKSPEPSVNAGSETGKASVKRRNRKQ